MSPAPFLRLFLVAAIASFPAIPGRAALPDGLYTTAARVKEGPTPVGYNSSVRSGFTLRFGPGWRLAQPVLPLDFTWLKPWMEGPGVVVRVRGVSGNTPAEAAAQYIRNARKEEEALGTAPFVADSGLRGVRAAFGAEEGGSGVVGKAAYFFANRPGFVYAFVVEPWPRGSGPLLRKYSAAKGGPLPGDALLRTVALERERVGQRDN